MRFPTVQLERDGPTDRRTKPLLVACLQLKMLTWVTCLFLHLQVTDVESEVSESMDFPLSDIEDWLKVSASLNQI